MDKDKPKRFYDTSSLLLLKEKAFEEPFYICHTSLIELERIKSSGTKDAEVKYSARQVVRLLSEHKDKYDVIFSNRNDCTKLGFDVTEVEGAENDTLILIAACITNQAQHIDFVTDDRLLALRGGMCGLNVISSKDILDDEVEYTGYKEVQMTQSEMAEFYHSPEENPYGCLTNEYLVIRDSEYEIVDKRKWNGTNFVELPKRTIKSEAFGNKIKPKDVFQQMVIDSIYSNDITIISGGMGAGKTLLSLSCAMSMIDSGKYDRIVALYNPTSTRGATQLGYYSGSMIDKFCQGSLGNILTSKFGDKFVVDTMISQNKLKLMSMADARGASILPTDVLWVSEAQNASTDLMKLCLSRVESGAKAIIEGDPDCQVDSVYFEGSSNGMRRAIEVLKGEDIFGCVKLPNIYRSKLADLVQKM